MKYSGIPNDTDILLFRRAEFDKQLDFLHNEVLVNKSLGWIIGPPGTGKSMATFHFAVDLAEQNFRVTWIRLTRLFFPVCVMLKGKSRMELTVRETSQIGKVLKSNTRSDSLHVVIIDGYVSGNVAHTAVFSECAEWYLPYTEQKRVIVVSCLSSRGKSNLSEDLTLRISPHFVSSWLRPDYETALQNPAFFDSVKTAFSMKYSLSETGELLPTCEAQDNSSASDLIENKYFYAGGCSRYMFQTQTDKVIEHLTESVAAVSDVCSYLFNSAGDCSDTVINRLFSSFGSGSERTTLIVSGFAARQLAIKEGPCTIERIANFLSTENNPSLQGWMFEMMFFARLRACSLKLVYRSSSLVFDQVKGNLVGFDPSLPSQSASLFSVNRSAVWMNLRPGTTEDGMPCMFQLVTRFVNQGSETQIQNQILQKPSHEPLPF